MLELRQYENEGQRALHGLHGLRHDHRLLLMQSDLFPSDRHDAGGKSKFALPPGVRGDAVFSACGVYRPLLRRWIGESFPERFALFIGMNPSTAEATLDDPTIGREWAFTRREGLSGYAKCNVADYRATSPSWLNRPNVVPVSPQNVDTILSVADTAALVVMAHGVLGRSIRSAGVDLTAELRRRGITLHCLGLTKDGFPRHPLYLRADAELMPY